MIRSGRAGLAWTLIFFPVAFCLSLGKASAASTITLHTSDISIQLKAGTHAPLLVSAAAPGTAAWKNHLSEALPRTVEIGSATVPVTWKLAPALGSADAQHVAFVYECANPRMRLTWQWKARAGFGPIEHTITVQNLSGQELWLPMIDSLDLSWHLSPGMELRHFYVEKGAGTPSPQGTHFLPIGDGYHWTGFSSNYAHPGPGEAREIIPIEFIDPAGSKYSGWYAGIEFSGRTRIALGRDGASLRSELGLNPDPGPFRTRLQPNGSFATPTVFLGAFRGEPDDAGNQLRPWVRAVLTNPRTWQDPQYPLMVNNSWGTGMAINEALALKMIADSKELGLEMFHMDAGWFRGVGDWYPNPQKFPHGLAVIADAAHRAGLRFGLWVDWTQAGLDTEPGALNARDPKVRDWLVNDVGPNWKPEEFKGQTIDLGVPAARDYAAHELKRIVEDYHLDMLEHDGYLVAQGCTREDHPHAPPNRSTMRVTHDWGADFVSASNSTDVSYHATRAYYRIYQQLRQEHPGLLFEICDDGGRMVDFGSASHGDYFSITDTYDPLSNRRAFYDTSYVLPPAMLESYVEKWPTPHLENFVYMLRSGMMGWMTIMQDTNAWSSAQHEAARQQFALYKTQLRPLIREARLWHISTRPDGVHWDGIEYWAPARRSGVVYAFRGTVEDEAEHRFVLKDLNPNAKYHLHFEDGSSPDGNATGSELMTSGLAVRLRLPLSSELIFISE